MLTSSVLDHGLSLVISKDYRFGICYFSAKYVPIRAKIKSKEWLARNLDDVSEWSNMSTSGILFQ